MGIQYIRIVYAASVVYVVMIVATPVILLHVDVILDGEESLRLLAFLARE